MNRQFKLLLVLFIVTNSCYSQNNYGPRITSMGNNVASIEDIWSMEANPAGITIAEKPVLGFNYGKYLFDTDLSKQAITFLLPIRSNYIGLIFNRYGISEYNEIKAGFALAKSFGGKLSIAIKANYHQIKISNYGVTTAFSADVGAIYNFNNKLSVGAYINNPSKQKYKNESVETSISTIANVGLTYKASDKLLIATSLSKDLTQAMNVSLGMDYQVFEVLSLRGGLTAKPFKQFAGFGINYKKLMIDVAVESDLQLGYSPQLSLAYVF